MVDCVHTYEGGDVSEIIEGAIEDHAAALAATALGLAYGAGPASEDVEVLARIAGSQPESLDVARGLVLALEVTDPLTRSIAAELLNTAARRHRSIRPAHPKP